jgi:cellulose synthase/poly-beta-1,6-N-acetylglucosamine synthase-like glycosyltransferase
MELIVRMHRVLRERRRPYRIVFVPDPVCWTDAPEKPRDLKNQRIRWQRGLGEALMLNKSLILNPRGGTVSWLAVPFYLIFEFLGPLLELVGYFVVLVAALSGWLSGYTAVWLLGLSVSLGVLLSTSAIMLEELSFHLYPRMRDVATLFLVAVLENFGYRQMTAVFRLQGLSRSLFGGRQKPAWEPISRSESLVEKTQQFRLPDISGAATSEQATPPRRDRAAVRGE